MPDLPLLVSFIVASFVVLIVPGITVSAVVSTALARGLAAGFWLELGAQLARFSMAVVVAMAVQVVSDVVAAAFDVIKYAGAVYLVWLGWAYLSQRHTLAVDPPPPPASPLRLVLTGFLVLWGNPKALIFFGAFLPQFVSLSHPAWPQVLLLGVIQMAVALITDGAYILVAALARGALTGRGTLVLNQGGRRDPDCDGALACLAASGMTQPRRERSGGPNPWPDLSDSIPAPSIP